MSQNDADDGAAGPAPVEAAPQPDPAPVDQAPAMQTDTSLIVDCVKGSSPPDENTAFFIHGDEQR